MENEKQLLTRHRQKANFEALRAAINSRAYVVPKDSELQPQIKDKTIKPFRKPLYPINVY